MKIKLLAIFLVSFIIEGIGKPTNPEKLVLSVERNGPDNIGISPTEDWIPVNLNEYEKLNSSLPDHLPVFLPC